MSEGESSSTIILAGASEGQGLGEKAYELHANADQVVIRATTPTGAFYGIQSLRNNCFIKNHNFNFWCLHYV